MEIRRKNLIVQWVGGTKAPRARRARDGIVIARGQCYNIFGTGLFNTRTVFVSGILYIYI